MKTREKMELRSYPQLRMLNRDDIADELEYWDDWNGIPFLPIKYFSESELNDLISKWDSPNWINREIESGKCEKIVSVLPNGDTAKRFILKGKV